MEACVACMNLHLVNDAIVTKLVSLAANDRVWKVKALAMQGMSYKILDFWCAMHVLSVDF